MGVPKRRVSHARQGERRSHLALELPKLEECPHCHEPKRPHHACPNCGYYSGRQASSRRRRRATSSLLTRGRPIGRATRRPGRDRARTGAASASPSTRWAATTPPTRSSTAPSTTPRRTPPTTSSSSATTRRIRASPARACPANVSIVHASEVVEMDEHPALALREKKDASILVAMDLVRRGEADAVVTAGHTGAGMAAAVLRLGRLPGVDRPALAVQMVTDTGPVRAARHRRQPRLDRREPLPVRAHGRDLRRARPRRRPTARGAAVDRRGEGQGRRPDPARRPSCSTRSTCTSSATSRARTSSRTWPTWSSATRRSATSRSSSSRACRRFIFDLLPDASSGGRRAARSRYLLHASPGIDRIRRSSTTSGSVARRCSASRARSSSPTAGRSGG